MMSVAGDRWTDSSGGVDTRTAPAGVAALATGAEAATVARALLHRMTRIPGRPESDEAWAEDESIRWVLQWTGQDRPDGVPKNRKRHQVALLRRYHRTSAHLGSSNRYSQALLWAYQMGGRI